MMEETNFEELYYQTKARCEMFIDEMVRMNNALKDMESRMWHLGQSSEELAREYDNLRVENDSLKEKNEKLLKEKYELVPEPDRNPTEE